MLSGVQITVVGMDAKFFVASTQQDLEKLGIASFMFHDSQYQPTAHDVVICDQSIADRCMTTCSRVFPVPSDEEVCPKNFVLDVIFPIDHYSRSK